MQNTKQETEWYEHTSAELTGFWPWLLHNPIIFSVDRVNFNYIFPKDQMAKTVKDITNGQVDRILIAPCGNGEDYFYLKECAKEFYGIDLSKKIIKKCPEEIETRIGDIADSRYKDNYFDVIVSPLFFHHVVKVGFNPFLREFHRILKPNGSLVILEPNYWYPLNIITRPLKKLGNPFGEVEDEQPVKPRQILEAMRQTRFNDIKYVGAGFSHCSFYVPIANIVNNVSINCNLLESGFKKLCWMMIYTGTK